MYLEKNQLIDIDTLMARIRDEIESKKEAETMEQLKTYELGSTLRFGEGGNIDPFLKAGWGEAADFYRWSVGKNAVLMFQAINSESPYLLSVYAHPMVSKDNTYQDVQIHWNEQLIGEWRIKERGNFHCLILDHNKQSGANNLNFSIPGAVSPRSCGQGNDSRLLGIGIHTLSLNAI
jgi:hypothetical protein